MPCCCRRRRVASVVSDSVRPQRRQPARLPRPRDSPGQNTGVGCHVLLQCRKVKSESEVTQSCLTLRDPMDCSPPGSSTHAIFQAREACTTLVDLLILTYFGKKYLSTIRKRPWMIYKLSERCPDYRCKPSPLGFLNYFTNSALSPFYLFILISELGVKD